MTEIAHTLKTDLVSSMPIERVFQKHVVDGPSYFFSQEAPDLEYELRHDLANALNIHIHDVVIVGSAKLGFSLKTHNFHVFDEKFKKSRNPRDKSDIDIAVISRSYFDEAAKQIFLLSRHFDKDWISENWRINAYYKEPCDLCTKYTLYLARGWLRPDLLPVVFYQVAPWKPVSEKWFKKAKREISVGFYSDLFYLKHYQMENLNRLRSRLLNLEI